MTELILGHTWWNWQEPVAHARPWRARNSRAVCGHRLSAKACYRTPATPLCGECVSILTGLKEADAATRPGPEPRPEPRTPPGLPAPANPWVHCPCGEYRFRLYSDNERTGPDGRWHSVLVCQKRREDAP